MMLVEAMEDGVPDIQDVRFVEEVFLSCIVGISSFDSDFSWIEDLDWVVNYL